MALQSFLCHKVQNDHKKLAKNNFLNMHKTQDNQSLRNSQGNYIDINKEL